VIEKLKSLQFLIDECPHNWAIRLWSKPRSVDEVKTPNGKPYKLINVAFYYVCLLNELLKKLEV
jgi:hypothetical protein